jgi:cyanate lyase
MLTKREAATAVQEAKARLGMTWAQLAEAVGRPTPWTVSVLLGQQPMSSAEAAAAVRALGLGEEVAAALRAQPTRGALDAAIPADPTMYRFYEVIQVYGPTIKELIQEEFGDGIMSAINFRFDVRRVPDPAGDRVVVTLDGKFLPYQWCAARRSGRPGTRSAWPRPAPGRRPGPTPSARASRSEPRAPLAGRGRMPQGGRPG